MAIRASRPGGGQVDHPAVLAPARKLVDEAVTVHVGNEARILAALSERERAALDRASSKLIARIASGEWRPG